MYFVTSDIHSYYSIFRKALDEKGFDINNSEYKLIICGDLFDRGDEAQELLDFLLSLPEDRLILIRGNHEDLFESCLYQLEHKQEISYHHWRNKTLDTISQLTGISLIDLVSQNYDFEVDIKSKLDAYFKLVNRALDYYELNDYVFVHGWVPLETEDWRNGNWENARWTNGIDMALRGYILPDKTIVCGQWSTSYGWSITEEIEDYSKFDIFRYNGLIALDGCTAYSGQCNILTI